LTDEFVREDVSEAFGIGAQEPESEPDDPRWLLRLDIGTHPGELGPVLGIGTHESFVLFDVVLLVTLALSDELVAMLELDSTELLLLLLRTYQSIGCGPEYFSSYLLLFVRSVTTLTITFLVTFVVTFLPLVKF
jgi:hypothetical protein